MPRTQSFALLALAGCLDLTRPAEPPSAPVSPQLTSLRANAASLDAVPRVPEIEVAFDRAMAPPEAASVMLFREALTAALVADARDGVVSLGRLDHRVPLRVQRDPSDPARWSLRAAEVLPPSTPLTLVFSERTRSVEGLTLTADLDGGVQATGVALQVVDAPAAGPLLTPALADAVDAEVVLLWLRADRPVRVLRADGVSLVGDDGSAVATRVEADERTPDAVTRVLRVTPARALRAGVTYAWRVEGLSSRGAVAAEAIPWRLLAAEPGAGEAVRFVDGVVCAAGEVAMSGACVELDDRAMTVRAATSAPAVVRLAVTLGGARRVTVTARGTTHRLALRELAPDVDAQWRLEAWDPAGHLGDVREGALRTSAAQPRVRLVEVLARPHSTSAQEFVEVSNEEDAEASIGGWVLESGGSRSVLPEGAAVPGRGRAVIVGAAFDPRGVARANDPAVRAGARVIVVRGSLAGRGLRDTGAELALSNAAGLTVSRFPGTAPELLPQEGVSVVRADAELDEDDPAGWVRSRDGASSPGGANVAR
ncbi:MAG: hypothetical protein JWM10_1465 [Myxococcaceae bacterium]|nr:hypothetical protein [Myxococcaceae bacterium]